jgi:DNA invertase Pin-like site-specific DNA recombinase
MTKRMNGTKIGAGYLRMSSKKQDKSPAEQREEISKLAAREGVTIPEDLWFFDGAITGDSSTEERPGLAALLTAACEGRFTVLFAWHTNRISREDPMDAIVFYNQLRKVGISLHTCCEGSIDLADFTKQLLLFVGQKANKDFLVELAAKVTRGKVASAKLGHWNGAVPPYGMDRAEFDAEAHFVRRLQRGERAARGHHLRLVPSQDEQKLEAIRYGFDRYDQARLSFRALARELDARGFPAPNGKAGWTASHVLDMLRRPYYAGIARYGHEACGKYYTTQGEDIVRATMRAGKPTRKIEQHIVLVPGAYQAIIDPELFKRVQRKIRNRQTAQFRPPYTPKHFFPLSGLLVCAHCGRPMHSDHEISRRGNKTYQYQRYLCATYVQYGLDGTNNRTCHHFAVKAERVLAWVIGAIQELYLGPGRAELVKTIRARLKARKIDRGYRERLETRIRELDGRIAALVNAIGTAPNVPELARELENLDCQREDLGRQLAAEAQRLKRLAGKNEAQDEAEQIANQLTAEVDRLTDVDPAIVREALHRFIEKIECRWVPHPAAGPGHEARYRKHARQRRKTWYELSEAQVFLRKPAVNVCGDGVCVARRCFRWWTACSSVSASARSASWPTGA